MLCLEKLNRLDKKAKGEEGMRKKDTAGSVCVHESERERTTCVFGFKRGAVIP